jgi:hypothetical protein
MARGRHSGKTTVRGWDLPGPRLTGWGWAYLAAYVAAPIMTLALLLDLSLYLVADRLFGVCYAVLCLF